MGALTLDVVYAERGIKKTMKFEPDTHVDDVVRIVKEKLGAPGSASDYGLIRLDEDPSKSNWLEESKKLDFYLLRSGDTLEFQKKMRIVRVRSVDGTGVKTVPVDESRPVQELMRTICQKMGLANHEEFSLVRDARFVPAAAEGAPADANGFMSTIGRQKQRHIQQLRAKLHTDDDVHWLDAHQTLRAQGVAEHEELTLRRKYFVSDTNVDTRDPAQLNMLYAQCRDGVLDGTHPVSRDIAVQLAALQCYIEYGPYQEGVDKQINVKDLLPKEYARAREHQKNIVEEYRNIVEYGDSAAPKKKYCELCQSLPTYGVTFYLVKEKVRGRNRLTPRLLGVNKDSVMRVDERTKQVLKEWPLEQVKRFVPTARSFTLDFGDYQDGYYTVQTNEGEKIRKQIAGYIDIILKRKRIADHLGIEGDEGSTMLEDVVAPARATLIGHGEMSRGAAAAPAGGAALRSRSGTPAAGGGAQYGAVSGLVAAQEMPRGERARFVQPKERAQRALIGTIEATIRAVEEAEEEMARPPQIDLLRFEPSRREWRVEVEKEAVTDRLAAMGAATAEVVQLTAIPEEAGLDGRVGTAIATIGSNLPEMGRGVRELAGMMAEEERRGDLIDASRRLMSAFGSFIERVHPERQEKRAHILNAASAVGESSHDVIKSLQADAPRDERQFHELIQRARDVATNTASLVMQAKTISSDCAEEALKERVIHSATQTAFATSELVACARVLAPTIEHAPSQRQLTDAAQSVARTVDTLVLDATDATRHSRSGRGDQQLGDLNAAARQVTQALDRLVDHIRQPSAQSLQQQQQQQQHRRHQENYTYEEVLRSSNRVIAGAQGGARDANQAIRHSRVLVEQFETDAAAADPNQRDKLLSAARHVAQATSNMISATQEAQSRPQEAEAQLALRSAAENLVQATNAAASAQIAEDSFRGLEKAAKDAAAAVTQTVSAVNSSRTYINNQRTIEELIVEASRTSNHVRPVIACIKESQAAESGGARFRAQGRLLHETQQLVPPAARLLGLARQAVPDVRDPNYAANLQACAQQLSTGLAELRVALNRAQQLNYDQQLDHTEELVGELDQDLQETHSLARRGALSTPAEPTQAAQGLNDAARQVASTLTQLCSAAQASDPQHVGASAADVANALRAFAHHVQLVAPLAAHNLDSFVGHARTVVQDAGNICLLVRSRATPQRLRDHLTTASASLRQTLDALPEHESIAEAVARIAAAEHAHVETDLDLRQAAGRLIEAASDLIAGLRQAGTQRGRVDQFVDAYVTFHSVTRRAHAQLGDATARADVDSQLEVARVSAANVLERVRGAQLDPHSLVHTQALSLAARQLSDAVARILDRTSQEAPWVRECDAALRKIDAARPLLADAERPVNAHTYYESLDAVTEEAKRLGAGLSGMAHHARHGDADQLLEAVRRAGDAVCGLAEHARQSAYLIGAGHAQSVRGRPALFDNDRLHRTLQAVQHIAADIAARRCTPTELVTDATTVASHSSTVATICRDANERTTNVNTKKQFVNCARDITQATSGLIAAVKKLDQQPQSAQLERECADRAADLQQAAQTLAAFVDRPEFTPGAAQIGESGRAAQRPLLESGRQMLDASARMFGTAKQLALNAADAATWQEIADNSRVVSESIKTLVTNIRDQAPGQADLDCALERLAHALRQLDQAAIAAAQEQLPRAAASEARLHQQIVYSVEALQEKVEPLTVAAKSQAEALAHQAAEHAAAVEGLVQAAVQAASLGPDPDLLLDQCRTVVEAESKLLCAAKDAGGNPKAVQLHAAVDEWASQLGRALAELERTVNVLDSQAGVLHGIVETISHSIAIADQSKPADPTDSFPTVQSRMVEGLQRIRQDAADMPLADVADLGTQSLELAECYRRVAEDGRVAHSLLTNQDLAYKLRVAVQKLGTAAIQLVRAAGQRRALPRADRTRDDLQAAADGVAARCDECLAALYEASRGTQACINAANTVSGIIGDLDTTILFATSGSLNAAASPQHAPPPQTAKQHRDTIVRTAKALVEDTKALVTGAASNQEQLAVAAQNAVRTIMQLTEAVRQGASALTSDSQESRVLVFHACRDVAASLSHLIQATSRASGRNPQDPAMTNLKEAAKTMVVNVTHLLRTIKSVEESGQPGTYALQAAMDAIDFAIKQYDSNEAPRRQDAASAEDVIRATRRVTEASQRATSMLSTQDQERLIAAANLARQAVADLLSTTLSAARNADSPELRFRTVNAGRDVALQVRRLLDHLRLVVSQPERFGRPDLVRVASDVSQAVGQLADCCEALRSAWSPPEPQNAAELAECELLGAASSIEAAAQKLQHLKPRHQQQNPDEDLQFDVHIINAAKQITSAVSTLVKAASAAQRELVQQGRIEPRPQQLHNEYQWSEGLVSAAKAVAAAVQQLCEAANSVVQGHASEEKLAASARTVASHTAQLLVACRVKADQGSHAMQRLQSAGHAVRVAAESLVNAARQTVAEDERIVVINDRMVHGIAQVMKAQEEVLRKERELTEARRQLAQVNKARYEVRGDSEDKDVL